MYFQTFVAILHYGNIHRKIRVLIVCGSLAGEMNYVQIGEEHLSCSVRRLLLGIVEALMLQGTYSNFACQFSVLDQTVIDSVIPLAIPSVVVQKDLKKFGIHHNERTPGPIVVLIGADVAGKIWYGSRVVLSTGVVAVETLLGWTLAGTEKKPTVTLCCTNLATTFTMKIVTTGDITDLWKLEVIGISDLAEKEKSDLKRLSALEHFKRTVEFVEGKYQVKFPWYGLVCDLPTNLQLAKEQLVRVTKKMHHIPRLFEEYDSVLCSGHYLSHRPMLKNSSSITNVCSVFDSSVKICRYPSLNDCLEQGPNMIELLPDILLHFRDNTIGKTFLQISFHPEDRDYLKFLRWAAADELITLKHSCVAFRITCSPFLLAAVLDYHLRRCMEECTLDDVKRIQQIKRRFYMDKLATSVDHIGEAEKVQVLATKTMTQVGFNLRG
ncbi:hypothetical protein PR048_020828 [Dryococelus australis]|uniref:Uncharacterized protein n=1 Tax=Dryococelus australis TaxID=614101 RepID=A0ABQ9GWK7_9NEOP|nr:hypothetical protein PR048_020828 [Dryococelus australis]